MRKLGSSSFTSFRLVQFEIVMHLQFLFASPLDRFLGSPSLLRNDQNAFGFPAVCRLRRRLVVGHVRFGAVSRAAFFVPFHFRFLTTVRRTLRTFFFNIRRFLFFFGYAIRFECILIELMKGAKWKLLINKSSKRWALAFSFTLNMGLTGTGDASPTVALTDWLTAGGAAAGGTAVAGESCDFTGRSVVADPTRPDLFLLRGSLVDFDPASSASINKELSCSNAIEMRRKMYHIINSLIASRHNTQNPVGFVKRVIFFISLMRSKTFVAGRVTATTSWKLFFYTHVSSMKLPQLYVLTIAMIIS